MRVRSVGRCTVLGVGLLILAAPISAEGGAQEDQIEALLTSFGATRTECSEELSSLLRSTVRLDCGVVEQDFKRFKQAWGRVSDRDGVTGAAIVSVSLRWSKLEKSWRRRYYWTGHTPLLVLFDVENKQIALARYEIHRQCRERARQLGAIFVSAEELGRGVSTPRLEQHVQPEFPERGRLAGQSALTLLWYVVDERGAVTNLCLVESMPRGHGFEVAAMEAVEQWRYEPASKDGHAVAAELLTRVTFEFGTAPLPYRDLLDRFFMKP
jgi:TonB family protein